MKKMLLLVVFLAAAYCTFHISRGFLDAKDDATCERQLAAICKAMNAQLPKEGSKGVRFDSVAAGPGRRMIYTYTFLNLASADIDPADLTAKMKPQLANGYKTDSRMAELRKMNVEVHFQYRDKDGNTAFTIVLSPKDL